MDIFDSNQKLNTPLLDAITEYARRKPLRFHMPSHKGICQEGLYASAPYDITELDFSDNLLKAEGVIRETERLIANAYGVQEALMFTCGATSGLFAALYCVKQKTDKIILSENSHKSIYNALSVVGLEPCFCPVEYDNDGIPLPISATLIERARKEHSDAGAVLITSPDYFGRVCDLKSVQKACNGLILVADAAHGGHFAYTSTLNCRAEQFSDITVLGVHKTLNCYTGSCVVLCKNEFYRTLCKGRELFHSSSPSYLAMASMDYSRALFEKYGKESFDRLKTELQNNGLSDFDNYDYVKVVLRGGERLSEYLKANDVYPECVYGDFVILIFTPFDIPLVKRVVDVLKGFKIDEKCGTVERYNFPTAETVVPFNQCFSRQVEFVEFDKSRGRILAGEIGLYPPGVPILRRGQRLNAECVKFFEDYKNSLFGVDSGLVCVLK